MMLLVKKSASGEVDQARVGSSHPSHSISIEELDNNGNKFVEAPVENIVGDRVGEIVTCKRHREEGRVPQGLPLRKEGTGAYGGGINKTLTIVGNRGILSPTVDPRASKEVVSVEIRPNERWVGGSTVPLHAFRLFNLSQDSVAYVGRERDDLVVRCLNHAGQVCFLLIIFLVFLFFSFFNI